MKNIEEKFKEIETINSILSVCNNKEKSYPISDSGKLKFTICYNGMESIDVGIGSESEDFFKKLLEGKKIALKKQIEEILKKI